MRPKFVTGDRFGRLELILVTPTEYTLQCSCGNSTVRKVENFDKQKTKPQSCDACYTVKRRQKKGDEFIRPNTDKEQALIDNFLKSSKL